MVNINKKRFIDWTFSLKFSPYSYFGQYKDYKWKFNGIIYENGYSFYLINQTSNFELENFVVFLNDYINPRIVIENTLDEIIHGSSSNK